MNVTPEQAAHKAVERLNQAFGLDLVGEGIEIAKRIIVREMAQADQSRDLLNRIHAVITKRSVGHTVTYSEHLLPFLKEIEALNQSL